MTCAICGQHHDRLADVIHSRFKAGESVGSLTADYGLSLEYIEVMIKPEPTADAPLTQPVDPPARRE